MKKEIKPCNNLVSLRLSDIHIEKLECIVKEMDDNRSRNAMSYYKWSGNNRADAIRYCIEQYHLKSERVSPAKPE